MEVNKLIEMYLFVFLGTSLVSFICCCFGILLLKLLKLRSETLTIHLINSFWCGYAIFISLLLLINIFSPINLLSVIPIFLTLIVLSIFYNKELLLKYIKSKTAKKYLVYFIGINILAFIYLRSNTYLGRYSFDTYNYHFYILRLANDYPAINGIANLFTQLSIIFSTAYHANFLKLLSPNVFFDNYLFFISAHTLVTAILASVLLLKAKESDNFFNNYLVISIFILLIYPLDIPGAWKGSEKLSGHFPDISYFLLGYVMLMYFFNFIINNNKINLLMIFVTTVSLVFIKPSSLFFSFTIVCISSFIWFKHYKGNKYKYFAYISLLAAILLIPYFVQNIIKSGALIFPISFTDLNLPWSNVESLKRITGQILGWARNHSVIGLETHFSYLGWVDSWFNAYSKFLIYHVGIYVLLTTALVIIFFKNRLFYQKTKIFIFTLLIIYIPSVLFWFFTAPDVRFIGIIVLLPIFILFTLIYTYFTDLRKVGTQIRLQKIIILISFITIIIKGIQEQKKIISLNSPIPITDKNFKKMKYDGVDVYMGGWSQKNFCSYSKLFPVSYGIGYEFIDPKKPNKGFLPRNRSKK